MARLAEAQPRREVCGFVVRRGTGAIEVLEVANAAAPGRAGFEFELDPAEELRILRRLAAEGGEVVGLFHSHLDAAARPSARDVAGAFEGGAPLWPGVEHVIVSVRAGRAVEVSRYRAVRGALVPAAGSGPDCA